MSERRRLETEDELAALLRPDEPDEGEAADVSALEVLLEPEVLGALRAEAHGELDSRDADWSDFSASVLEQIDSDADVALDPRIQAALNANAGEEIDRREGEWSAFSAAVFRRAREEEVADAKRPIEEKAKAEIRGEIERALESMSPRFAEGELVSGIERRLEKEPAAAERARREAGFGGRVLQLFRAPRVLGGLALAASVAIAVLLLPSGSEDLDDELGEIAWIDSDVSVEHVDFEGTVTVVEQDDVAVIWLADASAEM